MGRLIVWAVIAVILVGGAFWLAGRASYGPQNRMEAPVTQGNAA
ncbi:hypothetical protein SPAN111604_11855 [Sphingomonas antarctica]